MARLFFYDSDSNFKTMFNVALNTRVFCAIARQDIDSERRELRRELGKLQEIVEPSDDDQARIVELMDKIEILSADRRAFSNYENAMLFGKDKEDNGLYGKIFGNFKDLCKSFSDYAETGSYGKWDKCLQSVMDRWGMDCDTKDKKLLKSFCHSAARAVSMPDANDKDVAMRNFKKDSVAVKRFVTSIACGVFDTIKDIDGIEKFDRKHHKVEYSVNREYNDKGILVSTLTGYQVVDR